MKSVTLYISRIHRSNGFNAVPPLMVNSLQVQSIFTWFFNCKREFRSLNILSFVNNFILIILRCYVDGQRPTIGLNIHLKNYSLSERLLSIKQLAG